MSFDALKTGAVVRYPYLWAREQAAGESEGRKKRPAAVGLRIPRPDGDLLALFPITSAPPGSGRFAVEIPDIEKQRGGLDRDARLWLILDEYNEDVVGRSYYLEPTAPLGHLSRAFLAPLIREFISRARLANRVSRRS
ncbi:hypothetical protein [Enterovirga rhinocerotis]|uniref:PemK-like, MazF-like toxin of type II toxin-antitoxin system n=1 Tax=Enterovirga rhinocerotis TaxID=1339210 RepID=A0A4R7C920_9HYPH|nr:hypothetical protein [Enterovirga rhinocerotis]TDR93825.1 hypothetical protein EV668_1094 [Enterovirga rhinocerotis]